MLTRAPGVLRRVNSRSRTDLVPTWCQTWVTHRVPSGRAVTRKAHQCARVSVLDPAEFAPSRNS